MVTTSKRSNIRELYPYRILDESLALLEAGAAVLIGDAVEPVGRVTVVVALDAVDAEHEECADDGRHARRQEGGGVLASPVVDPAWCESRVQRYSSTLLHAV